MIPIAHATEMRSLLGGARLTRFVGCGHFPHRQEPATFVRALEGFLEATASSAAPLQRVA